MARDLISPRTRTEFREFLVGSTLRQISDEFDAAGIQRDSSYTSPLSGARRSLVDEYYHSLDFTKLEDVRRVLEVFENLLISTFNRPPIYGETPEKAKKDNIARVEQLAGWLKKDGYEFVNCRIVPLNGSISLGALK